MILKKLHIMRFCESRVMTEYHTRKPYFINAADELDEVPCSLSAAPSEDLFKKFQLYLTPPNSPPRENEDTTPQLVPASTDPASTSGIYSPDVFGFQLDSTKYKDATFTYEDVTSSLCVCPDEHQLIKDCMWNGVGHKASAALRKAHNRTSSPTSPFLCHANGCVDPRNIFPYPAGQPAPSEKKEIAPNSTNNAQKTHRPMIDGSETPSDSEEEIDVVTVEKTQNNTILKPKNRLNGSQKIVATIVPKQNGKVAIVTTSGASIGPNSLIKTIARNGEAERGRARNKFHVFTTTTSPTTTSGRSPHVVAMATGNGNLKEQKVALTGLKRRHTAEERCCIVAKESRMQMANPKHVMQRGDSLSPVPRFEKKRILSLDVSFCGSTGLRRQYKPNLVTPVAQNADIVKTAQEIAIGKFKINKIQSPITEIMEVKQEIDDDAIGFQGQGSKSPQNKRKRKAEALASLMSAGSGSDSEQIRAAHNVLERQRREGLRTSFHTLRDNVPELKKMEKTPKVNILNKARDHCLELQTTESILIAEKERLSKRNQRLQERYERAKKSLLSIRPQDSDIESDIEEPEDSPLSSLPPSLPPSPQVYAPSGYYIARRVASDNTNSPQEVMLRLESPSSRKNAKGYPDYSVKPAKSQTEIRAFIASLQKTPEVTNCRGTSPHQDGFSDGFECLDSDEDIFEALY